MSPKKPGDAGGDTIARGVAEKQAKAKRVTLSLLDRCLTSHCLDESRHRAIIARASKALNLVPTIALDGDDDDDEAEEALPKPKKARRGDEHNEICDVCDKGGDLLCCDTCNLVYHVACVRPKIPAVPTGKWSCAHCIVDRMAQGDVASAKVALRSMSRIGRGVDSEDEGGDNNTGRVMKTGEIAVVHSGKRYIVRKTARSQIVELGRFDTLEKALASLLPSSGNNSDLVEPMWCVYCLDDPSIALCAFCGCRRCFGKHDAPSLLICDACSEETHTYCLSPPLSTIPEDDWYCTPCTRLGLHIFREQNGRVGGGGSGSSYEVRDSGYEVRDSQQPESVPGSRRRGRPPGSGKRVHVEDGTFVTGGSPIMPMTIFPDVKKSTASLHRGEEAGGGAVSATAILPAGIDSALSIIRQCATRGLGSAELAVLSQLREWAPLADLELAFQALSEQRDIFASQIAEAEAEAEKARAEANVLSTGSANPGTELIL